MMSDFILGEVLVPQSRFIPQCKCGVDPMVRPKVEMFDESRIVTLIVWCSSCSATYREELPYAPDGVKPEY